MNSSFETQAAIVIPCFNEAKRLDLPLFKKFLSENSRYHLLFVNDGSSDQTLEVLTQLSQFSNAEVLDLKQNRGKAEAVREGLKYLCSHEADYLGFWDADLATPLDEISKMVHFAIENQYPTAVLGSRWLRLGFTIKRKVVRHYLGRIFATAASLILGMGVYDTQCGAKLFKREAVAKTLDQAFLSKWFFDIELIFRLKSDPKARFFEFPVTRWEDISGSKLKMTDFLAVPWELFKIYKNYR